MTLPDGRRATHDAPVSGGMERIVSALRAARERSDRDRATGVRLPSKSSLVTGVNAIIAGLFPNHFGPPDLASHDVDRWVSQVLEQGLRLLLDEVRQELRWSAQRDRAAAIALDDRATTVVQRFAEALPSLRARIDSDVVAAYRGDPAARSVDEVLIGYPSVNAVIHYRLAHALWEEGVPLMARLVAGVAHAATGVDIHPGARIGSSFFIDHGTGVVIGETAIIGDRVRLYQSVTLGARRFDVDEDGALVKGTPRHPIVEDDVVIYAGATILGRITVGRGSIIGGNVWLTKSVPPGSRITQAQVRTESFEAGAGI